MTDEKLIEEAGAALGDYDRSRPSDYERAYAEPLAAALRAVLAVFEKAHTPTEHPAHSGHEYGGGYARAAALAAGDPDWMNATGGTPTDDERTWVTGFLLGCGVEPEHADEYAGKFLAGFRRSEEPSAEDYPDAEGLAALRSQSPEPSAEPTCEHGSPLSALCNYAARYASGETNDAEPQHAKPRGEPSDAQVEAAWAVLERDGLIVLERSHVRAALRAASAVTESEGAA